jgi:hypothetical protein
VATGAKATGRAVVTGAKATKRAARIARVTARKADRRLLKAQGLSRQGGKVRKIKQPNPFCKNAAKGSKPKVKSDKKNPFADTSNVKPKAKARRAKKRATKAETKAEKRAREKTESLNIEKGYAQQRIDARKASRKRKRKS